MATLGEWAEYYLGLGYPVFPLNGKMPLVEWKKYQQELPGIEDVREWWTKFPEASIGLVTGPISGRLILDIDGAEGRRGVDSRGLPITQCVRTRRGLQHHYQFPNEFKEKTTIVGILPEVDVRGDKGICVLPPSLYSDGLGRYEWINGLDTPLAEAPQWLLDLLIENSKPKAIERENGESWLQDKLNGLKTGNRNDTFTAISGSLRARGYSSRDIFAFLEAQATQNDFPLDELQTICESVGSYPTNVSNETIESFSSFLDHEEKVEWLVPGLIAKASIGFIAGLPQTSKTWALMDLAIEAAKGGGNWLSRFPVKGAKVLFIDQERAKSETQRRFKALVAGKGLTPQQLNERLKIKCGSTTRLNLQESFNAFRNQLIEYRPDVVIVDSFATFHTTTENDRMEIQKVLELIKQLRNEFGCTFLFINHESKMSMHHEPGEEKLPSAMDMMGSVAVPAAAELVLTVRRKDAETCVIYNTKNTLAATIEPFMLSVTDLDEAKSRIMVRAS